MTNRVITFIRNHAEGSMGFFTASLERFSDS